MDQSHHVPTNNFAHYFVLLSACPLFFLPTILSLMLPNLIPCLAKNGVIDSDFSIAASNVPTLSNSTGMNPEYIRSI